LVTALIHGETEAANAERASKALFSGEIADLPEPLLNEVFANVPASEHPKAALGGEGVDLVALLVDTGLAPSKRQAREFLSGGSVSVNGRKAAPGDRLGTGDLLHGSVVALRRGKKTWHLTRWG
jgi:tyrosyl-tRNA synthetase